MTIETYTLWHGHFPLITHIPQDSAKHNPLCRYRVASGTMTHGAFPAHIRDRKKAEALANFHAIDGEPLAIEIHELEV